MNETKSDTNPKNTNESAPGIDDIDPETVQLEYSIRLRGGRENVCEFSSRFDIPMGLRQGHHTTTARSIAVLFDHAVQMPLMMAVRKFLEDRFRGRKENPARAAEVPAERGFPVSNEPSAFASLTLPETVADFEKMFASQDDAQLPADPAVSNLKMSDLGLPKPPDLSEEIWREARKATKTTSHDPNVLFPSRILPGSKAGKSVPSSPDSFVSFSQKNLTKVA